MKKTYSLKTYPARGRTKKVWMIMKAIFVFLVIGMVQVSASVYSQQTLFSMSLTNVEVDEVIKEIQRTSEFDFVFDYDLISKLDKVSVTVEDATVEDILSQCLENSNVDYRIHDKVIMLVPAKKVAEKMVIQQSKTITISGKVTDETGEPLPFVNIFIKGDTKGVITDQEGKYSITIEEKEGMIMVASFIGFVTKEFEVAGRTVINIMLSGDMTDLSEVVVTGYQTISKERATGSYAIVSADDMTSLQTSLQGKLEGMTTGVLNSTFGDGNFMATYLPDSDNDNRMIMRGISTMSENASPLVVIDGFPSQEGLSSVNPNDIDQITFLKDAAAASIWGSQSSNGVIVITTKKGSESDKPKVSYKFSHQYIPKWDQDYLNRASSAETVDFLTEELGDAPAAFISQNQPTELGYLMLDYKNGVIDETAYNAGVARLRGQDNQKQIKDELFAIGAIQQHDLSIHGGSDKHTYRAAVNYISKSGGYVGNENEKINLSVNNDIKLNDRLKASLSANFIYQDVEYSPLFASEPGYGGRNVIVDRFTPFEMLKDKDGNYLDQSRGYLGNALGLFGYYNTKQSQDILDNYGINTFSSILNDIDNMSRGYDSYQARLKASLDYKLIDGLSFNGGFQYERGSRTDKSFWGRNSSIVQGAVAAYTVTDYAGNVVEQRLPDGALQSVNTGDNYSYTLRGVLNYRKDVGKHSLTVLGGGEISKYYNEYFKSTQFGFDPKTLIEQPVDPTNLFGFIRPTLSGIGYTYNTGSLDTYSKLTSRDDRYVSYFGNMGYTFDNKYILTASGRIDNFNLYGGDSRFNKKPLWSVGAGWNISNEAFAESAGWLDLLKISYTYGSNGNVARGAIPELQISQSIDNTHQQIAGTVVSPKNEGLKWEETKTNNIRADFGLFNSKVSGAIDFYHRKSKDVLASKEIDPTHGLKRVTFNNGTIVNKGFEFELSTAIMQKSDFYWGARMLLSYNHNEVVDINTSTRSQYPEDLLRGLYSAPGKPTNGIYSFEWAGLDEEGHAQVIDQNGNPVSSYLDLDGTSMLKFSGTVVPKWVSSFSTQFKYKDFELSGMFVANFGHVMRKDVPSPDLSETIRQHADVTNRWKKPGDEAHTDIPKIGTRYTEPYGASYLYPYADINVVSASYIKLREVNLIYNLPQSLLSKLSIGSAQVLFQVNNPWKWTKNDDGIDPEAHELAYGRRMMPIMTSYTVGLNVNF